MGYQLKRRACNGNEPVMAFSSVAELIFWRAEERADSLAVQFPDASLSYGQLAELAGRVAGAFQVRGLGPGGRVALLLGNQPDLVGAICGGAVSGVITAPLNWHHRGSVLEYMLSHLEPSLVVYDPALVDDDQLAAIRVSTGCPVVTCRDWGAEVLAASFDGGASRQLGDILTIMYTSGATGRSKGATLPHGLYLAEAESFNAVVSPTPEDRFFTTLPLFHTNAQCLTFLGALLAGVPSVIRDGFSASGLMRQVRETDATVVNVLGAMVPMFLKRSPDFGRQRHLRMIVGGGIPEQLMEACVSRFDIQFRRIYGLTETGLNAGEFAGANPGSLGRPLPHNDIRIAGDGSSGAEGEIQLKALRPHVFFQGYWRDPEATRATQTDDGWFRTGDLGCVDPDGFIHFAGRIKESIRRRGENISCVEVEMAVGDLPEIVDCAAVAVPSDMAEDEVKLVYVLRPGADLRWDELWQRCTGRMASFMVPRYYEQVESIPRTPTEKVERYKLTATTGAVHDAASLSGVADHSVAAGREGGSQ